MEQTMEKQIMRKLFLRITPMICALYIIAFLDRMNVGMAALTMNKDLGIDAYTFGLGAGIFFIGYFIFEIPSNVILAKVGAKLWIARILFSWGIVAAGMAFIQGATSFIIMRFILGVAEAGLFPGIILYLTYWFPARYRARIVSGFMLAMPVSMALSAALGAWLLGLDGLLGFKGWQWLFLIEGIPAVLGPVAVLKWMPNGPSDASWLNDDERRWIETELESDREKVVVTKKETSVFKTLTNPIVWAFSLIYLASISTNQGLGMFLPQIIQQQGFTTAQIGAITMIPFIASIAGMLIFGYSSDRQKERKWHLITGLAIAAAGLGMAGFLGNSIWAIVALCFGIMGALGSMMPLWPLVTAYTTGAGAAAGIALVNSVANLGGFVGPSIIGFAKQVTNSFSGGLYGLACISLAGILLTMFVVKVQKQPTGAAATGEASGDEINS